MRYQISGMWYQVIPISAGNEFLGIGKKDLTPELLIFDPYFLILGKISDVESDIYDQRRKIVSLYLNF